MTGLIKHNRPKNYIQNLQEEMDRIMEDTFGSLSLFNLPKENKLWRPPIEMSEKDNKYKIKLQLPGFDKKDIHVEVGADYISVKAQNSFEKEEKKKNLYKSEFRYGNFMRTVSFPVRINPDKTHVEYKHGVLSIDAEKVMQKEITKKTPKAIIKKEPKAKTEKIPKEAMKKTKTKNKPAPKAAK